MIYLDVKNRKEDISLNEDNLHVVNEDFITFLHNFWTRYLINGTHEFNLKKFNPFELFATLCYIPYIPLIPAAAFMGIACLIIKMILKWNFDFLTFLDRGYFDSRFEINNKLKSKLLSWAKKHKDSRFSLAKPGNVELKDNKFQKENTHIATAKLGKGFFDTTTTYFNIKDGDGLYIIFFTYDNTHIINAQVVTFDGVEAHVEPIKEWKTVDPSEYVK